jgi:hypothetical protein
VAGMRVVRRRAVLHRGVLCSGVRHARMLARSHLRMPRLCRRSRASRRSRRGRVRLEIRMLHGALPFPFSFKTERSTRWLRSRCASRAVLKKDKWNVLVELIQTGQLSSL